jgi:hypothetical protein
MASLDINVTMNITLIIYLVTYLFVNGFLIYLLFRLRGVVQGVFAHSKSINAAAFGLNEANELNEIDELQQSLFEIQNTTARQLNDMDKLRQSLSGASTVPGANSGSGSVRIARSG